MPGTVASQAFSNCSVSPNLDWYLKEDTIMKVRIIFGIVIGGILGYLYYKLIGCYSGTCAITSNPVNSTIYGAIVITLLIELFHEIRISLLKILHRQKIDHTNDESKEID